MFYHCRLITKIAMRKICQAKILYKAKIFLQNISKTNVFPGKKKGGGQHLHTFTKGKTEEENKIHKRRIKMQEGMLRK